MSKWQLETAQSINYDCKFRLPKKAENPFKIGYDPELDISPELELDSVSYFKTIVCIL